MKIVGILGKAGSGKDTVADMLMKNHGFEKIAFADPIKRFCMDVFDFTEEQLWGPSEKRNEPDMRYRKESLSLPEGLTSDEKFTKKLYDFEDNRAFEVGMYLTPREALQSIGTQGARAVYDPVWVEYAIRKSKTLLSNPNLRYRKTVGLYSTIAGEIEIDHKPHPKGVIISDCRFKNEIDGLKKSGGTIIKIVRDGSGLQGKFSQHQSETEQDEIPDSAFDHIIYNNGTLSDLENKVINLFG